ncbi:hypothetical protein QBC41DRAFT_337770 [Cercophora samala]|uniref:Uncharacterized protein n=1 Tax=Cercophora samala TaxID=330535 RepID=A0AA39ZC07_9PEZI|nr:hypothetical protein QBC41DRAFT_337770 [Cercophora samala]
MNNHDPSGDSSGPMANFTNPFAPPPGDLNILQVVADLEQIALRDVDQGGLGIQSRQDLNKALDLAAEYHCGPKLHQQGYQPKDVCSDAFTLLTFEKLFCDFDRPFGWASEAAELLKNPAGRPSSIQYELLFQGLQRPQEESNQSPASTGLSQELPRADPESSPSVAQNDGFADAQVDQQGPPQPSAMSDEASEQDIYQASPVRGVECVRRVVHEEAPPRAPPAVGTPVHRTDDLHVRCLGSISMTGPEWTFEPDELNMVNQLYRSYRHPGTYPTHAVLEAMSLHFGRNIQASRQNPSLGPWETLIPPKLFCGWFYGQDGSIMRQFVDPDTGVFLSHTDVKIWVRFYYDSLTSSVTFVKLCLGPAAMNTVRNSNRFSMNPYQVNALRDCFLALKINILERGRHSAVSVFRHNPARLFYRPFSVSERVDAAFPPVAPAPIVDQDGPLPPMDEAKIRDELGALVRHSWLVSKSAQILFVEVVDLFGRHLGECSTPADALVDKFCEVYQDTVGTMQQSAANGGCVLPKDIGRFQPYVMIPMTLAKKLKALVPPGRRE